MSGQINSKEMLDHLVEVGNIFTSGKPFREIFQEVMEHVRRVTGAEGGSLYIYDRVSETLKMVVLTNDVLQTNKVVDTFDPLRIEGFIELPMRGENGAFNLKNISICCFRKKYKILVQSLDEADGEFDFTNTRKFDAANNYKTRNLLAFPLAGHNERTIGVLQLINSNDEVFSAAMQPFIDALAGQVSIVLNNALLVSEAQNLLSAIVEMVSVAIDEKSPHTAGHSRRVTALTMMISEALHVEKEPPYDNFTMNNEDMRELEIAAQLHDIGKIITPLHIMEKPTKLFALHDRINILQERLNGWLLSQKYAALEKAVRDIGREDLLQSTNGVAPIQLNEDIDFLTRVNQGEVFPGDEVNQRLQQIAERTIANDEKSGHAVINKDEINNLTIKRGTLNSEERKIMQEHVTISIRLLSSIPWPASMSRIVEYAGSHHEAMNGNGYPNNLTGDDMPIPSRILGMADRFEAISAPDRPYRKTPMTLSKVMHIMQAMSDDGEIDSDLFDFFKRRKLYLHYAQKYLPENLIDCE